MIQSQDTIRSGGAFAFFGKLIAASIFAVAVIAFAAAPADAQQRRQQPQQQKQAQQEPEETEIEQIQLTQAQIDSFIKAQKAIQPVTAKLKGQPNKQQMAQMEGLVKQAGFKDFDEFGDVGSNIGMVFGGIDPQTKKYDPASLIQKEIAQVNADKKIPAKQKAQILKDLEAASKDVPALKFAGNADLVAKNYDQLKPVMEEEAPQAAPQQQRQQPRR